MPREGSVLGTIGNTPLLELRNLDTGCCRLFVKLENQNPTGSIKDRIGLSMIEAAERDGHLRPGRRSAEHHHRGHGRQHRPGAGPGGVAEGLPADAGDSGQDGAGEDPAPARARRADPPDAQRCRQGPSGVLPGPAPRDWRARRRTVSTSISSPIPPIRWRTRRPPDRRSGRRPDRCSMRWWWVSAAAVR